MKRKLLAFFVTAAMIVGMAPAAFAGTFSDVSANASYAAAVERLAGLGVVNGVGGGKYDPEGTYTRAQFAALVTRLLGLNAAAQASAGPTGFKDVPASHWASGYINVASTLGIVKGMGDGTFRPNAPVTHAQALTMLVRALGYEPALKGTWPANVMVKAAELGLTKGVNVVANLPATRGEVAIFADNSLSVKMMEQVTVGDRQEWKVGESTLLARLASGGSVEGVLNASPEIFSNAADKITVGDQTLTLASGVKYAGLLGHTVKAWKNADGKVIFLEDKTPADKVKTAKVSVNGNTVTFTVDGKALTNAAAVYQFYNFGAKADLSATDMQKVDGGQATIILDDSGKVAYVVATGHHNGVVTASSAGFQSITVERTDTTNPSTETVTLKDYTVTWVGDASSVADVKKNDAIEYIVDATNKKAHIIVTRKTATGAYTARSANNAVTVGGTEYEWANNATAPGNPDNKTYTVILNRFGKAVKMVAGTGEAVAAKPVAMVTAVGTRQYVDNGAIVDGVYAKVLVAGGTEPAEYRVLKDAMSGFDGTSTTMSVLTSAGVGPNALVEYELNSAGNGIASLGVLLKGGDVEPDVDPSKPSGTQTTVNKASSTINVGGTLYIVGSSTTVFNWDSNNNKWVAAKVDDVLNDSDGFKAHVVPDNAKARAVVVTEGLSVAATSDTVRYGVVASIVYKPDNKYAYKINEKGTVTLYDSDSLFANIQQNSVVYFTLSGTKIASMSLTDHATANKPNAAILSVDDVNADYKLATVDLDGNFGTTDDRVQLLVSVANAQVFRKDAEGNITAASLSDLGAGVKVQVYRYDANDTQARVIIIQP